MLPTLFSSLALATALVPQAAAAEVTFLSQDGEWADVRVDGRTVAELRNGTAGAGVDLAPGIHRVELFAFLDDQPFDAGWLVVGAMDLEIGTSEQRGLEVYNDPRALADDAATATRLRDSRAHAAFRQGPRRDRADRHLRPERGGALTTTPVLVELSNIDSAWANVRIDGRLVAELRGFEQTARLRLAPGVHTIEIRDFMDDEVWSRGELVVGGTDTLLVGVAEDRDPVVYTDPGAFR